MAIGQERDATNHPGHESFDGELARLLMWERPLSNRELEKTLTLLKKTYVLSPRKTSSHGHTKSEPMKSVNR